MGSVAKLDWDSLVTTGLDLSGNSVLTIDQSLDLHAEGNVAFDALGGTLVGVALGDPLAVPAPIPGFELDLGSGEWRRRGR